MSIIGKRLRQVKRITRMPQVDRIGLTVNANHDTFTLPADSPILIPTSNTTLPGNRRNDTLLCA